MKIILAEDQPLILSSLQLLLSKEEDIEVAGTAENGERALDLCRKIRPDVAVLDIRMPKMSGLKAAEHIKKEYPGIAVLLLTTFEEPEAITRAVNIGVDGFLLKDVESSVFITTLRALAGGLMVFHPAVRPFLDSRNRDAGKKQAGIYGLTEKDLQIIEAIVNGLGNKEIAYQEGCTEGTVKNRVSGILNKMGLSARTQIAVKALKEDLI